MMDDARVRKARLRLYMGCVLFVGSFLCCGCAPGDSSDTPDVFPPQPPHGSERAQEQPLDSATPPPTESDPTPINPADVMEPRVEAGGDAKPAVDVTERPSVKDPPESPTPELDPKTPADSGSGTEQEKPMDDSQGALRKPTLPPRLEGQLHEPLVVMSEAHDKSCLVKVGHKMPELTLPDLSGEMRAMTSLYGQSLTVVVVWSHREALGRDQFRRLDKETLQPFRQAGVNVVAVNTGDAVEEVQSLYDEVGATFTCLLDRDGAAMATLATGKLPRTYLLDGNGRVLWLDIEYSRGSRRELQNALYYHLLQDES